MGTRQRNSQLSRSVEGRVVLVTGAASGMGRATAHLFADEGAKVAVTDRSAEGVAAVVSEIEAVGGTAAGWTLDVTDAAAIASLVGETQARLGDLDILVNNAGIAIGGSYWPPESPRELPPESLPEEASAEDPFEANWSLAIEVMLSAQMRLVRAYLSQLARRGEGRIINIASTEALGSTRGTGPYTVAKHGVVGLTRSLAVDLGDQGITANCICPGPILTGMTGVIPEAHREKFARRRVPLRRYGLPEEVAHATLSFALPAASFINGTVLPVDGGLTILNA